MPPEEEKVPSRKYTSVDLIPWDPGNASHCARLFDQRVACSWDEELIDEWKGKAREGKKFLYWIVSSPCAV